MSIKSVPCPQCGVRNNVPASMESAKCQGCGTIFLVDGPPASAPKTTSKPDAEESDALKEERFGQWLIVGAVAVMALVGLCLLAAVQFSGGADSESDQPEIPMRSQATVVEDVIENQAAEGIPEYRVVKLAESTRKRIYRDYSKMIQSSFGKSKKIPKSGAAGQMLNSTLGGIVDREVRNMATIHGISEEDIAQIYLEGQAKDW